MCHNPLMFTVHYPRRAVKDIRRIPADIANVFLTRIEAVAVALGDDPAADIAAALPAIDVARLAGQDDEAYRLRFRRWRALFVVDRPALLLTVYRVAKREDAYR